MKARIVSLGLGLALAGCSLSSEEDQVEAAIRNNLSAQGNVEQVELTRQDENSMNGFAVLRDRNGLQGRYSCTARRREGANFDWRCNQQIDEQVIQRVETNMRQQLAQQGEVRQVEMSRQDDNRMTGHAVIRIADGSEVRANCTATREGPESANFNWECGPANQAPAGEGGK